MISDDLSGLFSPNPRGAALPAAFRQAVLLAFNPDDGSNTVGIGTSTLADLPLLVTGAEIGLSAGDNILVMYLGNSAMIVGKVASVGGSNYGASSVGRAGFIRSASNFGTTNAGTAVIVDTSIVVPGWARSALVTMTGFASLHNSTASLDNLASQLRLACPGQSDEFSGFVDTHAPASQLTSTYAFLADLMPVIPSQILTCTYLVASGVTWAVDASASATVSVQIQFFRESA